MSATKKSVRFCESNNIVHDNDGLTKKDRTPLHYSTVELSEMKRDVLLAIGKNKNRGTRGGRSFHSRGLEHFMDDNFEFNADQRKDFLRDVVDLYNDVHDTAAMESDDNPVRQFSLGRSRYDRREAVKRAKQDEIEAAKVYKADKMRFKRTHSKREQTKTFVVSLVNGMRPRRLSSSARAYTL